MEGFFRLLVYFFFFFCLYISIYSVGGGSGRTGLDSALNSVRDLKDVLDLETEGMTDNACHE